MKWGDLKKNKICVAVIFVFAFVFVAPSIWDWIKYRMGIIAILISTLSLNKLALIVGIICTIVTCAVNWFYEHKKFKAFEDNINKRELGEIEK